MILLSGQVAVTDRALHTLSSCMVVAGLCSWTLIARPGQSGVEGFIIYQVLVKSQGLGASIIHVIFAMSLCRGDGPTLV